MSRLQYFSPCAIIALALTVSLVPTGTASNGAQSQAGPPAAKEGGGPGSIASEAAHSQGWLIVDGELVSPPYAIEVLANSILINGYSLYRQAPATESLDVPERTRLQHERLVQLQSNLRTWTADQGLDQARSRALDALRSDPIVVEARWDSARELWVRFDGESEPELVLFDPDEEPAQPAAEARIEFLTRKAATLRHRLSSGSLLAYQDGILFSTPSGEGSELLSMLESVAFAGADEAVREQSYRTILGDRDIARGLARHFSGR